jgi:sodium/hydrogen exchanger 10/11
MPSSSHSEVHAPSPENTFNSLAVFLDGFVDTYLNNASNTTPHSGGHGDDHSESHEPKTLLFLFFAFAVGALVRHLFKKSPIPYTVILICIGLVVGAVSNVSSVIHDFTQLASIDPHLMLYIFLPILIFESAFAMDVHTFKKTVGQSLVLAGPGMVTSAVLTSVMARYLFNYNWPWTVCLLFGTILSATDPVAVVSLLKGLGAPIQLGTVIEGESLLNDGAAIVLFNVLLSELLPHVTQSGLDIFLYFVRVALVGPLFGWFMGKLTVLWLSHVFNDALIEITITLVSTYITYFIGEAYCQVSGVLSVVALGIEISSRKSNISPEVEKFLHRFWEMLGYLANTLIFILVGVVISQQAFSDVESLGWMYLIVLYFTLIVIRLIVVLVASPVISKIGYNLTWQHGVVISWGGLRGAVGLALALVVVQEGNANPGTILQTIGNHFLFYSAGIVVLTLLVNATTTEYLLKFLGMSDISHAKKLAMAQAVRRIQDAQQRAVNMLKSDPFLADANWEMVEKSTTVKDPYEAKDEKLDQNPLVMKVTHCPECSTEVPRVPHPKELAEIAEEARIRTIKAEKTSYWKQFEQGMLGRDAVLILNSIADAAMDTPKRLLLKKDIESYWEIPKVMKITRSYVEQAYKSKGSDAPPPPKSRCLYCFYVPSINPVVDAIIMALIAVNIILTIVELVITDEPQLQLALQIINYFFVLLYITETVVKMLGLRKYYWFSKWNIFDFFITVISVLDTTVLDVAVPSIKGVNPGIIRVLRLFRILRILRAGRLLRVVMRLVLVVVDHIINRRLKFGYDIGKGFVVAKEEMLKQLDKLDFAHQEVVLELKERSEAARLDVIRSLGLLRKDHPGVAQSVKTHQAIRSVLNHCVDTVKKMFGSGILDESDADKLLSVLEVKMKKLNRTPATLPLPNPEEMLHNLTWVENLDDSVVEIVVSKSKLVHYERGDIIYQEGEELSGMYIIVSGLVKVFESVKVSEEGSAEETVEGGKGSKDTKVIDLMTAGNVLGEVCILTHQKSVTGTACETDVQVFMLAASDVKDIIEEEPDVKEGLWRSCGIRIASHLLLEQQEYQDWSSTKISLLCEGSYIIYPPVGPAPTVEITDKHEAVVVLHGKARCLNTREKLVGPCLVPRNVNHILLDEPDTVLLIIPKLGSEESAGKKNSRVKDKATVRDTVKPYVFVWQTLRGAGRNLCQRIRRVTPDDDEESGGGERKYSTDQNSSLGSDSLSCDSSGIVKTVVVASKNPPISPESSESTTDSNLPPPGCPPGTPIRS